MRLTRQAYIRIFVTTVSLAALATALVACGGGRMS